MSIGYLISYIFFLLVNFFPEIKREKEKERELLPLRCARHREIEVLIQHISIIWGAIFVTCIKGGIIDRSQIKEIGDLFNFDTIKKTLPWIDLSQPAVILENTSVSWYNKLIKNVEAFEADANKYLSRYKDMEPAWLYYNIFYILNNSYIIGRLPMLVDTACYGYGTCSISLDNVIVADKQREQIENTCKYIVNINSWFIEEYKYLLRNIPDSNSILNKYDFIKELDKSLH